MKNKNYMKNDEKELSTKRYALNNILGDPSKLEEARKLANYEKPEPAYLFVESSFSSFFI